jgi:hypothetical protein
MQNVALFIPISISFPSKSFNTRLEIEKVAMDDDDAFFNDPFTKGFGRTSIIERGDPCFGLRDWFIEEQFLTGLADIFIPSKFQVIWPRLFSHNLSLRTVVFSEKSQIREISAQAFFDSGIRSITIPSTVEKIGMLCFCDCKSLIEINLPRDSKLKEINRGCFLRTAVKSIFIPSSVEVIMCDAFAMSELRNISFSENSSLKVIERNSFGQSKLEKIEIPRSVERIDGGCFVECPLRNGILFSNECLLSVFETQILSFTKIDSIVIPNSVEEIHDHCFFGCNSLSRIVFGEESLLQRFGALGNCHNLTEICLPKALRIISGSNLVGLRKVSVHPRNPFLKILDDILWGFGKKQMIKCLCMSITRVTIPEEVEVIGDCCFFECRELCSVDFAENSQILRIERSAFLGTKLEEIRIPKSIRFLHWNAFSEYCCIFGRDGECSNEFLKWIELREISGECSFDV